MVIHVPEPDAADQALAAAHLDPTTATRDQVDAARAYERKIREDQNARISKELHRQDYEYPAKVAEYTTTDPGW